MTDMTIKHMIQTTLEGFSKYIGSSAKAPEETTITGIKHAAARLQ
jgi:hypothetical protein